VTERSGGLPDAPDLAAAFAARPSRKRPDPVAPSQEPVETPQAAVEPEEREEPQRKPAPAPVALVPAQSAPPAAPGPEVEITLPNLGPIGKTTMQCAVNIELTVQARFTYYQDERKAATGLEPTNAVVMRRAVSAANKKGVFPELLEAAQARLQTGEEEDEESGGLFGEVEGRKASRGRTKATGQQPFRPSRQELAVIDALWRGFGFPSRSDFMNAVLDWWLPQIPRNRK
jgi:hypothetical protein